MTNSEKFCKELELWCGRAGLQGVKVELDDSFHFDCGDEILYFGMESYQPIINDFEEFLYEYGCEYYGICAPTLCMIHEVGHGFTKNSFNDTDMFLNWLNGMECEDNFSYWHLPMEFSANMWEINFINSHIDKVQDLTKIILKYFDNVSNEYFKN